MIAPNMVEFWWAPVSRVLNVMLIYFMIVPQRYTDVSALAAINHICKGSTGSKYEGQYKHFIPDIPYDTFFLLITF
jgi:hypothetical protein